MDLLGEAEKKLKKEEDERKLRAIEAEVQPAISAIAKERGTPLAALLKGRSQFVEDHLLVDINKKLAALPDQRVPMVASVKIVLGVIKRVKAAQKQAISGS